ncbi:receptor-like protein kinase FERONIA [Heracleum sosnowskyi]|uniref:Receptor-like protein kinase FERONIA n=1 Tax=Heracleum sosnowskyi TaxID=360622 RepID=A0AAD8J762_9APIA|nr:receptor-like protein kinase FERONIA [Heracleum sosnowskyi]
MSDECISVPISLSPLALTLSSSTSILPKGGIFKFLDLPYYLPSFLSPSICVSLFVEVLFSIDRYIDRSSMRSPCQFRDRRLVLGFVLLAYVVGEISAANYLPADNNLVNCGGPSEEVDGRQWTTDNGSKFVLAGAKSSTSPADTQKPSVPEIPYMTARVFQSEFTYSIPVASGRKFVRLHFYPASYGGLNASKAIFSVSCGPFTLLKNFSAAQTTEALNYDFIVKEYSVNVPSTMVNITFTPDPDAPDSYAFVNGIEVVSHPDIYTTDEAGIVGLSNQFSIDNFTAIENVYRLNVGGNAISPSSDTGLFRSWYDDMLYIFGAASGVSQTADSNMTIKYPSDMPTYVAPVDIYKTARTMGPNQDINAKYNLTWVFSVDSGFSYLIRLHFCEVSESITKINQRVFEIFINNKTADGDADVVAWTESNGVPIYKDFVVIVPNGPPQQDLWLALHPNLKAVSNYNDAILNGVEIFKINGTTGILAGPNPIPAPKQDRIDPSPRRSSSKSGDSNNKSGVIGGSIGGTVAVLLIVGLLVCFLARRQRRRKDSSASDGPSGWLPLSLYGNSHSSGSKTTTTGSYASSLPSTLCRHFSFAEIKAATKNFDEALILGLQESAEESGKGFVGMDMEEGAFDVISKGKKDPDSSLGFDGNVTDSRSTGMSMSIGGRSLASEDSDGLTPSAVFSQIMNPKGR